jgi:hypothetical protein
LKGALADTVPELARTLGGPFAAAAARLLARVLLGREGGSEEELEAALLGADPETLVRLKLAAVDLEKTIHAHNEELARIEAGDRANARAREMARQDRVPAALAVIVVAGFFAVLGVMLFGGVPREAETEFSIMLGALGAMAAAVMNYYFGSSVSSREKTHLLQKGAERSSRDPMSF